MNQNTDGYHTRHQEQSIPSEAFIVYIFFFFLVLFYMLSECKPPLEESIGFVIVVS